MRLALLLALLASPAAADGPVHLVPYDQLEARLSGRIDFEEFARTLSPGLNHDTLLVFEGARIGERFAGQSLAAERGFDRLAGPAASPLTLQPGAPGRNLAVAHYYYFTNQVQGIGPAAWPERDAGGEGAVAILFDEDQSELGFKAAAELRPDDPAAPRGLMWVAFFRRDGGLIAELAVDLDWGRIGYGFAREGGVADIAGIAITNRDPAGLAYDDIIFSRIRVGS